MATYQVTFKCGHTEDVVLFGPIDARMRRIEYLEQNRVCSCCAEKAHLKIVSEKNNDLGLEDLDGTEKQVKWANDIRLGFIRSCDEVLNKALSYDYKDVAFSELEEIFKESMFDFQNETLKMKSAKFWIENRFELDTYSVKQKFVEICRPKFIALQLKFNEQYKQNKQKNEQ